VKWPETDFLRGHSLTTSIVNFAPKRNNAIRTVRVDAVEIIKFLAARNYILRRFFARRSYTRRTSRTPPKTNIELYSVPRMPDRPLEHRPIVAPLAGGDHLSSTKSDRSNCQFLDCDLCEAHTAGGL
jgi:hypothetical protein